MTDLTQLYKEVILDHNKSPRNFKELNEYTHKADGHNPLCGDKYTIYLDVKDDIIVDIGFEGSGCAISKSSASIMTTILKGSTVNEAEHFFNNFHKMLTDEGEIDLTDKMCKTEVLKGVKEFPSRIKCATLIWHTMKSAIESKKKE
jgi:nitrogen fixation NifU-like protein